MRRRRAASGPARLADFHGRAAARTIRPCAHASEAITMPSYLDLGLIVVILVSALLSMVRGFTREVLAIGSWAAAAAAAYFFYPVVTPYIEPYIHKQPIPQILAAAVVFFATLIVVSVLTVRISDAILDSKVGALDRSLGFVFGAVRGFLLGVVAFAIFSWLVAEKQQPEWVKNAKTRPILEQTADRIKSLLPEDAVSAIDDWWKKTKASSAAEEPPDESLSAPAADSPPPAANPPAGNAPSAAEKQKLDAIIGKPSPPAAPTKPPAKP
jgi:membrane protein required for colicin V production